MLKQSIFRTTLWFLYVRERNVTSWVNSFQYGMSNQWFRGILQHFMLSGDVCKFGVWKWVHIGICWVVGMDYVADSSICLRNLLFKNSTHCKLAKYRPININSDISEIFYLPACWLMTYRLTDDWQIDWCLTGWLMTGRWTEEWLTDD